MPYMINSNKHYNGLDFIYDKYNNSLVNSHKKDDFHDGFNECINNFRLMAESYYEKTSDEEISLKKFQNIFCCMTDRHDADYVNNCRRSDNYYMGYDECQRQIEDMVEKLYEEP